MNTIRKIAVRKKRTGKDLLRFYSYGIFIVLLGFTVTYQFIEPTPPKHLTIAAGSKGGAYLEFALQYKKLLALNGVELTVLETEGSIENLSLLGRGEVDIALLQSGIAEVSEHPDLLGIGSLYFEPLWIFTRKNFVLIRLSQLYKRRLVLGPEGSGTRKVVLQLLDDNGIDCDKLNVSKLTGSAAAEALVNGEIDIMFIVAATSSPTVKSLLNNKDISIANCARADAYTRRHDFLSKISLPQGVISLKDNIPSQDITLVAPAATLVTSINLHPALTGLLTQVIDRVHNRGSILNNQRHQFPSTEHLDFPLSEDAARFYKRGVPLLQRYLPFWAAIQLDRLKLLLLPLLALLLPLFKIVPLTYRWRMRARVYRWYDTLQVLDYEVRQDLSKEAVAEFIERLHKIEEDVRQISVPLAYAAELYSLRQHIDLLRRQIKMAKK